MNFKNVNDAADYKDLIEKFSYFVDCEMKKYEDLAQRNALHDVVSAMPKLISLVNTIGYLRGQDNAFLDYRPKDLEYQNELYQNEDFFEERLRNLITRVLGSPEKEQYLERLNFYFLKVRGE